MLLAEGELVLQSVDDYVWSFMGLSKMPTIILEAS
jgi:hypothetical protein